MDVDCLLTPADEERLILEKGWEVKSEIPRRTDSIGEVVRSFLNHSPTVFSDNECIKWLEYRGPLYIFMDPNGIAYVSNPKHFLEYQFRFRYGLCPPVTVTPEAVWFGHGNEHFPKKDYDYGQLALIPSIIVSTPTDALTVAGKINEQGRAVRIMEHANPPDIDNFPGLFRLTMDNVVG